MDPQRFDRWSKSIAGGLTRRQAVGSVGAAGLLGALLPWRSSTLAAQADRTTCTLDFEAEIAVGRESGRARTRVIAGELTIAIGPDGAIDEGVLIDEDGEESRVVGQATGRAISLRISLDEDEVLVALGVGDNDLRDCRGDLSGSTSGPGRGDVGDWVATARSGGSGSSESTQNSGNQSTPVSDGQSQDGSNGQGGSGSSTCNLRCIGDEIEFDEANCACICPPGTISCITEVGSIPAKGGVIFYPQPVTVPTGYCTDPLTDVSNCGACDNFCTGDVGADIASCNQGVCNYTCKSGYAQCGGDPADPCTTDLNSDRDHCGSCGYACPGNLSCNNGLCTCLLACFGPQELDFNNCECTCPGGLAACGGGCVDLNSDFNNCGSCGNLCGPTFTECQAGKCVSLVSQ